MTAFGISTGAEADAHFAAVADRFDRWIQARGFRVVGPDRWTPAMKLESVTNTWYGGRSSDGRPVTVRLVLWTTAVAGSGIRADVIYAFSGLRSAEPRASAAATALVSEITAWWEEDQALHPRK
jgi:hypothetical protein